MACGGDAYPFNPSDPARGPGSLLGGREPINDSFVGGASTDPEAAQVMTDGRIEIPICDGTCRDYCDNLALDNPLDAGMCRALWGVGFDTRPVVTSEACRRMHVDLLGVLPSKSEADMACAGKSWGEVASDMLADERFVFVHQRRWADRLRYNNVAVSIERIYDADRVVKALYRGEIGYDEFAAIVSAHPVLTRRHDTPADRAEALFTMFLGRPPYEHERSDMARLYVHWNNGYYDHPTLGQRLPDAVIEFPCANDEGRVDPNERGQCTSVLWGYRELVMTPDYRSVDGELWSGLLTADEWHALQEPGRVIAGELGFWEFAVDQVLQQYLGYDLAIQVPEARQRLVEYLLAHDGDIRALHYAVVTSQLYLQSSAIETPTDHRYTFGPLKQVPVEPWIDAIRERTGVSLGSCDHRIPQPEDMMGESLAGTNLVQASNWTVNDEGRVRRDYRDLARTLGGCPDNNVGGRFETVSILTTATQEGFVAQVCDPSMSGDRGAEARRLLPGDVDADAVLGEAVAEQIMRHQVRLFFGRDASDEERNEAREVAGQCAPAPCTAEAFARPVCYALLSSSEMLFY